MQSTRNKKLKYHVRWYLYMLFTSALGSYPSADKNFVMTYNKIMIYSLVYCTPYIKKGWSVLFNIRDIVQRARDTRTEPVYFYWIVRIQIVK